MARLRDMRDLIQLVKKSNDGYVRQFRTDYPKEHIDDKLIRTLLIDKDSAIEAFAKTLNGDEQKALDIYGDATSNRYKYIREPKTNDYSQRAEVTSDGRGLIEKWRNLPTGIVKDYINKNFSVLTIVISIIGGIIIGLISAYISYKIYKRQ